MYNDLIANEDTFLKKVVTDKYQEKYDQFKKRIQKHHDKQVKKDEIPFQQELESKPVSRVVPPIPDEHQCYCRREVRNTENAVRCANGP